MRVGIEWSRLIAVVIAAACSCAALSQDETDPPLPLDGLHWLQYSGTDRLYWYLAAMDLTSFRASRVFVDELELIEVDDGDSNDQTIRFEGGNFRVNGMRSVSPPQLTVEWLTISPGQNLGAWDVPAGNFYLVSHWFDDDGDGTLNINEPGNQWYDPLHSLSDYDLDGFENWEDCDADGDGWHWTNDVNDLAEGIGGDPESNPPQGTYYGGCGDKTFDPADMEYWLMEIEWNTRGTALELGYLNDELIDKLFYSYGDSGGNIWAFFNMFRPAGASWLTWPKGGGSNLNYYEFMTDLHASLGVEAVQEKGLLEMIDEQYYAEEWGPVGDEKPTIYKLLLDIEANTADLGTGVSEWDQIEIDNLLGDTDKLHLIEDTLAQIRTSLVGGDPGTEPVFDVSSTVRLPSEAPADVLDRFDEDFTTKFTELEWDPFPTFPAEPTSAPVWHIETPALEHFGSISFDVDFADFTTVRNLGHAVVVGLAVFHAIFIVYGETRRQ